MALGANIKIRDVNRLTRAEEATYVLYKKGLSRKEIAENLGVKTVTVTATLKRAIDKVESK